MRLTRTCGKRQLTLLAGLLVVISAGCDGGVARDEEPPGETMRPTPPLDGLDEAPPVPDPCDGFDNDVDGDVDEGCYCEAGEEQACWPGDPALAGIGSCWMGRQMCQAVGGDFQIGHWGPCVDHGAPSPETCGNDLDEDCDGVIAECGVPSDPADP